jgi:hypothetical protein
MWLPSLCRAAARSVAQARRYRVIIDNLGSHKSAALRRMIQAAGARLWYLPPYSPDLNPIEQAFAKIKHWMRTAQMRTIQDAAMLSDSPEILPLTRSAVPGVPPRYGRCVKPRSRASFLNNSLKPVQRQMRCLLDPLHNEIAMRIKHRLAIPAHLHSPLMGPSNTEGALSWSQRSAPRKVSVRQ